MTELTAEQRDIYAPPGTTLRRMLNDGVVPWPTLEAARRENHVLDVIERGKTTIYDSATGAEIARVDVMPSGD